MKWEPWSQAQNTGAARLNVDGPPCSACINWRPHVIADRRGDYDGVALCVAEDMQHDFSCYRPNPTKED